ncbi:MAG: dicarboxylate/amino acid:cation symporter [Bacteroidales bacterium]
MKNSLYWKILTGFVLGLVFGILFPTNHKITDSTLAYIEKSGFPGELAHILQNEKKAFAETETEFLKRIKPALGPEYFEKYKKEILFSTRYNPYLRYVGWFGDLFMRALKMIILPLVIVAVISGISDFSEYDNLIRVFIKTVLYYVIVSCAAIFAGLGFVHLFKPGSGIEPGTYQSLRGLPEDVSFSESIMDIVPVNIFESLTQGNLLSIIFFCILFGFFITKVNDKNRIILNNFFNALYDVLLKITAFIVQLTPIGVFALIATFVAGYSGDMQKLFNIVDNLGKLIITIFAALFFHSVVSLPLIMKFAFRLSPWKHFKSLRSALITAFSTSSAFSTLSYTMSSVQKNCGVSSKISSFILPLGTTVNMDGTAIYISISALFIAQLNGIELSLTDQIAVIAVSLFISIGASGIQMSSFATLTLIIAAMGLPFEGIGLILSIDIILEMFRSTINVWSQSCCAVIIAKSEGETLKIESASPMN